MDARWHSISDSNCAMTTHRLRGRVSASPASPVLACPTLVCEPRRPHGHVAAANAVGATQSKTGNGDKTQWQRARRLRGRRRCPKDFEAEVRARHPAGAWRWWAPVNRLAASAVGRTIILLRAPLMPAQPQGGTN